MTKYEMTLTVQVYDRTIREYLELKFKVNSIEQGYDIVNAMLKNKVRVREASVSAIVIEE
jgi:hypothetical protein